jgi:hypothetical protein
MPNLHWMLRLDDPASFRQKVMLFGKIDKQTIAWRLASSSSVERKGRCENESCLFRAKVPF